MRIEEQELFASFVGKTILPDRIDGIGWPNGTGYGSYADCKEIIISRYDFCEERQYFDLFKLTDALVDRWDYKGVDFRIYIYVKEDVLVGGHVFKYVETSQSSHFRPTGYETDPTQQELRIAKRIMEYITQE